MSDTLVINTSTEYINLSVTTTTEQYSLSVTPPQTFAYWGTVFGVLSTQTDLWAELSAKALEVDLQSLSGQVLDLETFIATVSSTWSGGQEALTVLAGNSAFWDTAFARSAVFSSVSSRYDGSSTVVESSSSNWNYAYDTAVEYSSLSSTFATNSTVSNVSSLLTPLTLTNDLTSQLVLNNDFDNYKTGVSQTTATLLPTSTYQQASGNWQGTFTTVQSNSANWDFGYDVATYVQANSANWEESSEIIPTVTNYLSTVPVALSSVDVKGQLLSAGTDLFDIFLTTETDSQTLSYIPSSYNLSISNGNTVNLSSINTTFAANSGKYEDVYSSVVSNSANWDIGYDTAVSYSSVSSTFATNSTVDSVSSLLTPLTLTSDLTSQLVLNTDFNNYQTSVAASTATLLPTTIYQQASGNWQSTYTSVQSNSAIWNTVSTNITANNVYLRDSSTSVGSINFGQNISKLAAPAINGLNDKISLWDFRGTGSGYNYAIGAEPNHVWFTMDVNNGTGGFKFYSRNNEIFKIRDDGSLILKSNQDILESGTLNSLLLSTKNKADSAFTNVQSNSANWNTAFNRSTVFSSVSGRYNSSSTVVESNSANWNNAYNTGTVYQANSGNYAPYSFVNSNFLNLTGGTVIGDLTLLNNLFVNGSAVYVNTQDLVVSDPLIYIAEGNPDDSLDIGIMAAWVDPVSAGGVGYQHGGLVRRADDKAWTLFKGATAEPLSGVNVDWSQPGIQLEPLSAKFYGDIYGDRYVFGSLSASGPVYGSNLNIGNWDTAFDRSSVFSSVSGRYDSSSTVVESNSANWDNAYNTGTVYQSNSATYATNTLLQSTSALLTPLTLTETLTSQLVTNTDLDNYKTDVASATATLLPTTTYQQASGNWQSTYTTFSENSANYVTKSLALAFSIAL